MRAIAGGPGGPEVLEVDDHTAAPRLRAGDVLIDVVAAGVNRADLLQRQGLYPPPPGESSIIGLECSGTIAAADPAGGWSVGDRVCALLSGGGYAEQVAVPAGQVMPVPAGVDLVSAAALPEVACTVYSNVEMVAGLQPGEWLLVHGGGSGIGTFAIQWARAVGAHVAVTVGSAAKAEHCRRLGAELVINYRDQDFVAQLRETTDGHGADVILDIIGAKYLDRNVKALAVEGRLVVIGLQGGIKGELNLAALLSKRGSVTATSLRGRPAEQKADVCAAVTANVWPLVAAGRIEPVIDRVLPLAEAAQAHHLLEASDHFGKVVLQVR